MLRLRRYGQKAFFGIVASVLVFANPLASKAQTSDHHPPQNSEEFIKRLEDPAREAWQQPDQVVYSLDLRPDAEVAEIGAGSGYFSIRLAKSVGPSGRVYAVDVDQKLLDHIDRRAEREKLDNIQTILADADDPKLGSESVDVIFICDTLHHIGNRQRYYPLLTRALRPGGKLVIVDFHKRSLPVGPPVEMKIDRKACLKEIEAAGFRLVEEFLFLKYQYFFVFELED